MVYWVENLVYSGQLLHIQETIWYVSETKRYWVKIRMQVFELAGLERGRGEEPDGGKAGMVEGSWDVLWLFGGWVCMFIHKQNVSWNMVEVRFWSVCRRKQMGVTRSNPDSPLELPDFSWWRQNLAKSRGKTGYITFLGVQTSFSSTMHSKKISLKR